MTKTLNFILCHLSTTFDPTFHDIIFIIAVNNYSLLFIAKVLKNSIIID